MILFVRCNSPTCNVPIKMYQDIDTGKYVRDKMEKIVSYNLGEITSDVADLGYTLPRHWKREPDWIYDENKRWFLPRDDDWED